MKKKQEGKPQTSIAERLNKAKQEMAIQSETIEDNVSLKKRGTLFVNGRLNRKKYEYSPRNVVLLKKLSEEINSYCKGIEVAVLNYLIHKGLESVKKNNSIEVIDFYEVENFYNS